MPKEGPARPRGGPATTGEETISQDHHCRRTPGMAKGDTMKLALYFLLSLALIVAGLLAWTTMLLHG